MSADGGVLAVCVNWNGRGVLGDTLAALVASAYSELRVWVVDNASRDGSLEEVPSQVRTLRLARNGGYAAAINAAVREASKDSSRPRYYLLINNDVVVTPDLVWRLVEFAEGKGPGIFGPAILRQADPSRLDAAWGRLSWSHVLARYYGKGAQDGLRWRRTRRVELLLGCLLLVHADVFDAIGPLDERFFMYHEEVDFLYRASRGGFPSYYCPFRPGSASGRPFHPGPAAPETVLGEEKCPLFHAQASSRTGQVGLLLDDGVAELVLPDGGFSLEKDGLHSCAP